jgi:hypothetical protein
MSCEFADTLLKARAHTVMLAPSTATPVAAWPNGPL